MPRYFAHGNGRLLVQIDPNYCIRDLFWPLAGQLNHLSNDVIRFGVWIDGQFSWTDSDEWQRYLSFGPDGFGRAQLVCSRLGVSLDCVDAVDAERYLFTREITVISSHQRPVDVRLFFHQSTRLSESDIGDTVLYIPQLEGMVHFKRDVALLFGGKTDRGAVDQYTTGVREMNGCSHTAHSIESGQLRGRAIDQGSVDSILGLRLTAEPFQPATASYWIVAAHRLEDLEIPDSMAQPRVDAVPDLGVSPEVQSLVQASLHVVRTQTAATGAILAANDSSILETNRATYSYMWPRDGALVAMATDALGVPEIARDHFRFCRSLLSKDQPFFFHKYCPDGSLGATWHPWIHHGRAHLPIQEDETSLFVLGLCRHAKQFGPDVLEGGMYEEAICAPCDFMCEFVNDELHLPRPSYDLWEERHGIHAYTVVTVIAALREAADIAEVRGESVSAARWRAQSERMTAAMLTNMVERSSGRLMRCLAVHDRHYEPDLTVDSALLSAGLFGVLAWDHPVMQATFQAVEERLVVRSGARGVARYENDYYFRKVEHAPGNPWIICTMWYAQALAAQGRTAEAREWLDWACQQASPTLTFAEQVHPDTGEPLSVSPLTWSHAEFIRTATMLAPTRPF